VGRLGRAFVAPGAYAPAWRLSESLALALREQELSGLGPGRRSPRRGYPTSEAKQVRFRGWGRASMRSAPNGGVTVNFLLDLRAIVIHQVPALV
jgi:hypothetical protein